MHCFGFFNLLGTVVFIGLAIAAFRHFFGRNMSGRAMGGRMGHWFKRDDAVSFARDRFARGEMSSEQFETIMRTLHRNSYQNDGFNHFFHRDNALEVAQMRFVKGEITAEEFEAIRRSLEK